MSKTNTILMLAVAAVPAALVMYVLVMAFLGSFEAMPGMLQGIVALTLLCCAVVVLLPVYAAVAGPKTARPAAKAKKEKEAAPAEAAAATEEADLDEAEAEGEFIAEEVAAEEAEEDLFAAGDDEEFDYLDEEPPKK